MPKGRFRSLTVDEETYEELRRIAAEQRLSISKVVTFLVDVYRRSGEASDSASLTDRIKRLEARLAELEKRLESSTQSDSRSGGGNGKALKAFLGETAQARIRSTPIVVRRGEIFLEGVEPSAVADLAERFDASVAAEYDDADNLIGTSIVPNTGFRNGAEALSSNALEEWFERSGRELLKELSKRFAR